MIKLNPRAYLLEAGDSVQLPRTIARLYADFETSSGNSNLTSLNPWRKDQCFLHMAAITWDDHPNVYAIPRGMLSIVTHALSISKTWINQNVKYDTHVVYNNLGFEYLGGYVDTLTLAKLIDSDRTYKGGYGLDTLSEVYLKRDLSHYYKSLKPWLAKNKDYGQIPLPTLGEYACEQIRATRDLHKLFESSMPEDSKGVYETEKKLTKVLVAMERRGMSVDIHGVKVAMLKGLRRLMQLSEEISVLVGYKVNPLSNKDCEDLFINRYGMPPIYKEKKGIRSKGPSFEKAVLKEYSRMPGAPYELLKLMGEYRHEDTMRSLFWEPWLSLQSDGILHSDNNQCVRSGRTSCKEPNNQQLNMQARALIRPRPGYALVVHDYDQIEYRFIIHYIGNERSIKAYQENPDVDFHQFIAELATIKRKPAKVLNLACSYRMGKAKTVRDLSLDESIMERFDGNVSAAQDFALQLYHQYHRNLPELRRHWRIAENAARSRGYVKNAYGRRMHIPLQFARVGFNRVCQSHAADLIKERAVALHERAKDFDAHLLALVHDEVASEVPVQAAEEYAVEASKVLNQSSVPLRVPIRCSCGISDQNWALAKGD